MKIHYLDKQGLETVLKLLKNKISSIVDAVVFRGTVANVATLPSLSDTDVKPGDMYTVLNESTTTADFVEGAGKTIDPYTEVVVVNQGTVLSPEYKWYVLGNVFTQKDKISYGQALPNMPYDGMLFFYMGPDVTTAGNELYSNSFYAYNESENTWDYLWTLSDKIWRGTQAEWDALSAAEKDRYEQAEIIGLDNNGVVYVVDRVESGNMNPVTSNAVAKAITAVGQSKTGSFPATTSTGILNSSCILTEGKWLVLVVLLFNVNDLQGDIALTIGGVETTSRVRCSTTGAESGNATLVDVVTIAEGESKAVGIDIINSTSVHINGDAHYWYVRAVRVA